jgi:hypothetical protein
MVAQWPAVVQSSVASCRPRESGTLHARTRFMSSNSLEDLQVYEEIARMLTGLIRHLENEDRKFRP